MKFTELYENMTEAKAAWIHDINILKPEELDKKGIEKLKKIKGPIGYDNKEGQNIQMLVGMGIIELLDKNNKVIPLKSKFDFA